jgi:hypothetical protein
MGLQTLAIYKNDELIIYQVVPPLSWSTTRSQLATFKPLTYSIMPIYSHIGHLVIKNASTPDMGGVLHYPKP